MQCVAHTSLPDNHEGDRSDNCYSNRVLQSDQPKFLTSPHEPWTLDTLTQINSSVESLISQVEDKLARPHERVNSLLPGYPQWCSPLDTENPYGSDVVVPHHYFYNVTNWQKKCMASYATYQLRVNIHPHWDP